MYSENRSVKHSFNLSGMSAGEWFLGCEKCWFRGQKNTVSAPQCPVCLSKLRKFEVTEDDVTEES